MSTQLEELQKLYSTEIEVKIPKDAKEGEPQATLKIKELALDDMAGINIGADMPMSELVKSSITMIAKSLGVTDEAAGKLTFKYMEDLLVEITSLNKIEGKEAAGIDKVKDFLKSKDLKVVETDKGDNKMQDFLKNKQFAKNKEA